MNILFKIFYVMILLVLVFSCKMNKLPKGIDSINIKINDIDFFDSDYQIIDYSETETALIDNKIFVQKHFKIKITSSERIMQIRELTNPIIYLNINGKNYLAKGQWYMVSIAPYDCDFLYFLDENNKIWFPENDIIVFVGDEIR